MPDSVTWRDVKNAQGRDEWLTSYERYLTDNFAPSRIVEYSPERKIHLFEPSGSKECALLCIPGGGFKKSDPKRLYPVCDMFAKMGFLTASIEYTTLAITGGTDWRTVFAAGVEDTRLAVVYLKGFTKSVGIYGVSAGGALGLGAAKQSGIGSPDFLSLVCPAVQAIDQIPGSVLPIQIQHGSNDDEVPLNLVREYVAELDRSGFDTDLTIFENATHFVDFEHWTEVHKRVETFLASLGLSEVRIT